MLVQSKEVLRSFIESSWGQEFNPAQRFLVNHLVDRMTEENARDMVRFAFKDLPDTKTITLAYSLEGGIKFVRA